MKKNIINKIIGILLCMLIFGSVIGCNNSSSNDDSAKKTDDAKVEDAKESKDGTFKLGAYLQLTGNNSVYGNESNNSIKMAIDEINEAGGFNGQQIEYVVYDTQGSAEEAVKVVNKLIQVDKVDAVIGSINSNEVLAVAGLLNEKKIFNFGLGTSSTWMQKDWPYVFRASFNNDFASPTYAKIIAEDLKYDKAAVFYGQDDSSFSNGETMMKELEKAGVEVISKETYDTGDVDYSAQIRNMIQSGAQAHYFVCLANEQPLYVKQMRQAGQNGILFNKDTFVKTNQDIVGPEASNYIVSVVPYVTYAKIEDCTIPLMSEFLEKYNAKYGELPGTEGAYRAWDTAMIFWEATKVAGANDSDSLKDAMPKINNYEGLGGKFDYSIGDREGLHEMNAFILIDGISYPWSDWFSGEGYEKYKADPNIN